MARKLVFIATIFVVLAMASACGPQKTKLSASDNNKSIDAAVGGQIVIALSGNPSTGYTWEAKDLDSSMFQQVGETQFKSSNPGLAGASGTQTLTFKALKAGAATLTLIYHRPWEKDVAPLDTFTINVTVK
ncbi:MAG TPA: protease inhibitor I42 family protein [Anaerolineales bacterium]|nr:protease inhibitor I42 family protein [Anaerolineales bacterium]